MPTLIVFRTHQRGKERKDKSGGVSVSRTRIATEVLVRLEGAIRLGKIAEEILEHKHLQIAN